MYVSIAESKIQKAITIVKRKALKLQVSQKLILMYQRQSSVSGLTQYVYLAFINIAKGVLEYKLSTILQSFGLNIFELDLLIAFHNYRNLSNFTTENLIYDELN